MKYATSVPTGTISIVFDSGKILRLCVDDIHADDKALTLLYGAKQKVSDAAASALKLSAENGLNVEDQRYKMAADMIERLKAGTAFARSTDGAGRVSYLILAVGELYSMAPDAAAAKVKELSDEKQKALTANPKVQAVILRLKAEAAAAALARVQENADDEEEELPEL